MSSILDQAFEPPVLIHHQPFGAMYWTFNLYGNELAQYLADYNPNTGILAPRMIEWISVEESTHPLYQPPFGENVVPEPSVLFMLTAAFIAGLLYQAIRLKVS